jgi:hypothetical protein
MTFPNDQSCVTAETWHGLTHANGEQHVEEIIEISLELTTIHGSDCEISEISAEIRTFDGLSPWILLISSCRLALSEGNTRPTCSRRENMIAGKARLATWVRVTTFPGNARILVLECE